MSFREYLNENKIIDQIKKDLKRKDVSYVVYKEKALGYIKKPLSGSTFNVDIYASKKGEFNNKIVSASPNELRKATKKDFDNYNVLVGKHDLS